MLVDFGVLDVGIVFGGWFEHVWWVGWQWWGVAVLFECATLAGYVLTAAGWLVLLFGSGC